MRSSRTTFFFTLLLAMLVISCVSNICIEAKEIVATDEWHLIQEGETIPQGLHVKMNMETGEKWVKLLSKDDEDGKHDTSNGGLVVIKNQDKNEVSATSGESANENYGTETSRLENAVKITQLANAELSADASAKITSQLLEQAQRKTNMMESIASLNDFKGDMTIDETDYAMMYRTLMSLPEEDRGSMGTGLPSEPADDASEEEQKVFEEKVRAIWSDRQALLKQMEEEYIADVTDIIADRIESLTAYVSNPMLHVQNVITLRETEGEIGDGDLSTIIGVLQDLEYQLTDVDLARDFHQIGGWPLLVALLTDTIHGLQYELQNVITKETQTLTMNTTNVTDKPVSIELSPEGRKSLETYQQVVWEIQGLACWSIGTAVKNMEEFHSWALDDFSELVMSKPSNEQDTESGTDAVTVITILLDKMDIESFNASILEMSPLDTKARMKRKYEMYALGALLRGNRKAIRDFSRADGPTTLYNMFSYLTSDTVTGKNLSNLDLTTVKLLTKIIALADDLIMDVTLHPTECSCEFAKNAEKKLMSSLLSTEWCMAPMELMSYPSLSVQRKMLETMVNLAPHCTYIKDATSLMQDVVEAISSDGSNNALMDEELNVLLEELRKALS